MLEQAKQPLVILGGRCGPRSCGDLRAFAESSDSRSPARFASRISSTTATTITWRRRNRHQSKLAGRVRTADVLLVIGARLGEMTTGAYTLIEPPRPKQKLVHVHAGAEELGRVYQASC